ncbi:MAG: DUF695 domain-containing protein [Planctomycetota bacterium]|nr:DUF695 domain-containing protein [Planctomycetota bacterium]
MDEQWIGHVVEAEEGVLSCLVNTALGEHAPDASRPCCTLVRVPFAEPGEDGMGSQDERDALHDAEESLGEAIAAYGVLHVATVRGAGVLDLWYYSSTEAATHIGPAAKRAMGERAVEVGSQDDPEWSQYGAMFPPPEAFGQYLDWMLIETLESKGDRLEQERPVDHGVYLPTKEAAAAVERDAARAGFEVTDRGVEEGDEAAYFLQLTRTHAVTMDVVQEMRAMLTEMVESHDGVYDGWATAVVE